MAGREESQILRRSWARPEWLVVLLRFLQTTVSSRPLSAILAAFVAGILFWGAFNWSLEATSTETFCISCHVMEENVYREYRKSAHFTNRTGVRASCPDCHVPKEWIHKVVRKIGATNELFHWLMGSISTPGEFNAKRLQLAGYVWNDMVGTDSRECRNCHGIEYMNRQVQDIQARTMHGLAEKWGTTCIECHQGIVHTLPEGFDEEAVMDALHDRMEEEKVDCRSCHLDMAAPSKDDGWGKDD
ncbi:MAG TPA: NapC/NirT family cytochrome c [Alphaproteobacteria bacterium]|jgi:cytochrome c-type protein NapC|nr:NapC/NirT family cytochrome c [Alphaproteobacteria bacterium]MDP7426973.1 NapC/NirT family cytochrome c [Alphaproteobacteria bacterium]HJM48227.1 NapC/NirT family cytochrome c [Alphaproteobacteria bacterium]